MKGLFVKFLMLLSSFSMVLVFYIFVTPISFETEQLNRIGLSLLKYIISMLLSLALSALCLFLVKRTVKTADNVVVVRFRQLESSLAPTYIGLFVISLGLGGVDYEAAIATLFLLFILWSCIERNTYFNPIWLLFGYNFYEVETRSGNVLTLILRHPNLKTHNASIDSLVRINEYTYMEK